MNARIVVTFVHENARVNARAVQNGSRQRGSCVGKVFVVMVRLLVAGLAEGVAEPLETFVETVTGGSAGRLDVLFRAPLALIHNRPIYGMIKTYPSALPQAVQTKLVGDLGRIHGIGQILLVGEDKQESIPQLVLVQHALQLLAGLDHTVAVVAVDDEDDALGVLEVMPPQRPDLVLPAHVPHGELDVLVLDGLDVEAWVAAVRLLVLEDRW